jgi:hypothetical protein
MRWSWFIANAPTTSICDRAARSATTSSNAGGVANIKPNIFAGGARYNRELNESYWKQRTADLREEITAKAAMRFWQNHDALLVQGRLRRRLGMKVTLSEAKELVRKYGCCYPTVFGLTPAGRKECERIRSRTRYGKHPMRAIEIRMLVYEDGVEERRRADGFTWTQFVIPPAEQKQPYQRAARQLREWQQSRKKLRTEPAA